MHKPCINSIYLCILHLVIIFFSLQAKNKKKDPHKVSKINILFNFSLIRDNRRENWPTPGGKGEQHPSPGYLPKSPKAKRLISIPQKAKTASPWGICAGSYIIYGAKVRGRDAVSRSVPSLSRPLSHKKPLILLSFFSLWDSGTEKTVKL